MIISLGGFIVSLSTSFPFQYDFTIVPGRLTEYIYIYIYYTYSYKDYIKSKTTVIISFSLSIYLSYYIIL